MSHCPARYSKCKLPRERFLLFAVTLHSWIWILKHIKGGKKICLLICWCKTYKHDFCQVSNCAWCRRPARVLPRARVSGCWVFSPRSPGRSRGLFSPDSRDPGPVWWQPGPGEHSAWQLRDRLRDAWHLPSVCGSHKSDRVSGTKWCQKCESDESRVSVQGNVILDTGNIKRENDKTNFHFVFVSSNYKN